MQPSPTETWHQTVGRGKGMNEGKGREEEEPGIKLLPMPGRLASSARGGGPVCPASLWGRTNRERLGPEACGREGARSECVPGFLFHLYNQSTQQFAARHPQEKNPFSVEVNGPAQINGSVGVPSMHHRETPTCSSQSPAPHRASLHLLLLLPRLFLSTGQQKALSAHPNAEARP